MLRSFSRICWAHHLHRPLVPSSVYFLNPKQMKDSESPKYTEPGVRCNAVTLGVLAYTAMAFLLLILVTFVRENNSAGLVSTTSFLTSGFLNLPGKAQGLVHREYYSSQVPEARLAMDNGDVNKPSVQNKSGSLAAVDFEVHGKVQGVFFRKYTKDKARELGLAGWVRNTESGTVSGQMQGNPKAVATMKQWLCKTGSPQSHIQKCDFTNEISIDKRTFSGFEQRE